MWFIRPRVLESARPNLPCIGTLSPCRTSCCSQEPKVTTWQLVFWLVVLSAVLSLLNAVFGRTRKVLSVVLVIILGVIAVGSRAYEHSANERVRRPRYLTPVQVGLIYQALRPFAGQPAAWVSIGCVTQTTEAHDFVQQLARAALLARWEVETSYMSFGEALGVSVGYDAHCAGASSAAGALASALRRCGVAVQGPNTQPGRKLATPILVLVGDR
jgi:hypothetical protein